MHASEALQHRHKKSILERFVGRSLDDFITAQSSAYRRRVRMFWSQTESERADIGFYRRESHEVINVPHCLVLLPRLQVALPLLQGPLADALQADGEIFLGLGEGGRPVLALQSKAKQPASVVELLERMVAEGQLAGAAWRLQSKSWSRKGNIGCEVKADGETKIISPVWGFSQANAALNLRLVEKVKMLANVQGKKVVELFCGRRELKSSLGARGSLFFGGGTRSVKRGRLSLQSLWAQCKC